MLRALCCVLVFASPLALAKPPRLTLLISVDSLGTDVLMRARPRLRGALGQLLNQGAFFPNARYDYAETVTAAGHATLSTGANPWRHGVVGNRVFNRITGKSEAILADAAHPVLEVPAADSEDASPENLMAETLADHLRMTTFGKGKAVAIAAKARAAIPLAGHLGQAWWFSESVGKFVTGTYYLKEFPSWMKAFNERKLPDQSFGKDWTLSMPAKEYAGEDDRPFEFDWLGLGRTFPHKVNGGLPSPGPQFYSALQATPAMLEILVQAAKAAIDGEQLGKDDVPDLLEVSFSPIDRIYHLYGPYSWETQDAMIKLDRAVTELIGFAERAAGGRANLLIVLTSDHGGSAIPEEWAAAGLPASRINPELLRQGLAKELKTRFGADLVVGFEETDVYLQHSVIADKKLDGAAVRRAAAAWLAHQPGIAVAIARDDLGTDRLSATGYARSLALGYYPERSGDVVFLPRPFNVMTPEPAGANHGSPYAYDAQVPVIFQGKGIRPGLYAQTISATDVAPTLSTLLEMGFPASCEGNARSEILGAGKP